MFFISPLETAIHAMVLAPLNLEIVSIFITFLYKQFFLWHFEIDAAIVSLSAVVTFGSEYVHNDFLMDSDPYLFVMDPDPYGIDLL